MLNTMTAKLRLARKKPTIGLILCEEKNEAQVSYMLPKGNTQIFASQYK